MSDVIPTLDEAELAILEPLGTRREVAVGDYLYRAGDMRYDFFVVLAGLVEIDGRLRWRGARGRLARGRAIPR